MNILGWTAGLAGMGFMVATLLASPAPVEPRPATLRATYGMAAPTSLEAGFTALVMVDFQEEFFRGKLPVARGASAATHGRELLAWARESGIEVVHVHNVAAKADSPVFAPGSAGARFADGFSPTGAELTIVKASGGGFTKTNLDAELRGRGIDTIVVAGIMTHLAVEQTARDAALLGYRVVVASDASATRDLPSPDGHGVIKAAAVHEVALASLADRFADPMTTAAIRALPIAR